MVLTQTTSLSPGAGITLPAVGQDGRTASSVSGPSPQAEAPTATAAAGQQSAEAPVQQVSAASGVGFTLNFDPDTQRMILEARDPSTGFVINSMPPKYVIKQFSSQGGGSSAAPRGTRLDDAS
jgi:hypothetical protein